MIGRLRAGTLAIAVALPTLAGTLALAGSLPACIGSIGGPAGDDATNTIALRSRYPRLTHEQWENTVQDLLQLDEPTGMSASFTGDPLSGFFDNSESAMTVAPGLWADYQTAAEELSKMLVSDPAKLERILPPADASGDDTARARAFIEQFGKRAYRRPLSASEIDSHLAVYAQGKAVYASGDDFKDGMTLVLQAFLQSPHFIYRVERSTDARVADALIPLDGWEVATRLSYTLWGTMPDDALFEAAATGELETKEGVKAHAERMLKDPRALDMIRSFHRQLFQWDHYYDLYKDDATFPEFGPELRQDMVREAELFVQSEIFERGGGLKELLTSRVAFVNQRLADVYGVEGTFTPDEFTEVTLPEGERAGVLTRLGFLAANGTAFASDPIHRGVFVNLRVLCAKLPPPPNNVTPLPPADSKTTRERVTSHTGPGTCGASCHGTLINPIGFAFEHYNAIGRFRTEDNGFPVNSADQYPLGGQLVSYGDAIEFSQVLADSQEAHRCWAQNWLQFAYGRNVVVEDTPLLDSLAESSRGGMPLEDLLIEIVTSDAFLTRRPVEAP
ncbi:DUF1592 domain-containing protein [Polyangium aurulentum]|uniref:DUF1592 domain-containing protein n=1 Tax=Polyangium aurulentum TaxID=2567896 RepID=UPI001980A0D2|nr:DUF1592 domain-containing protein [Polyangium aurulentum]UQA58179.1 DUF1592 domain-containing protein [Polyangium aurulentum]